ncbi:YiiX family permuted papain-like enzyme [bacterium]|nr:YiiX family permuted papain-like enzyme [bacterium]
MSLKNVFRVTLVLMLISLIGLGFSPTIKAKKIASFQMEEGDILFQGMSAGQGLAIQIATGSPYSHCAIVVKHEDELQVLEAVQPVRIIPLDRWIKQGDGGKYVVKRLKGKDSLLTEDKLAAVRKMGTSWLNINYDLYFGWGDDRLYCSELVWKLYDRAVGVEVGKLQQLKEFNLDHPIVQAKIEERYGENVPYEEEVISPSSIFDSEKLETVYSN